MKKSVFLLILLLGISSGEYVLNHFVIKFNQDVNPHLTGGGYVSVDIPWIDALNQTNSIVAYEKLFDPGIALSPDDPFFTDGLDKCWIFTSSGNMDILSVIAEYRGDEIDFCQPDAYAHDETLERIKVNPIYRTTEQIENREMDRFNIRSTRNAPQDTEYHKQWYLKNNGQRPDYDNPPPTLQYYEYPNGYVAGVDINAEQAWETHVGHPSWTVAICSNGIGTKALDDLVYYPDDFDQRRIAIGYNVIDHNNEAYEAYDEHFSGYPQYYTATGTTYAMVIGAKTNNSLPFQKNVAGVDWGCHLMPIRVWSGAPSSATMTRLSQGINWASTHNANVILITTYYDWWDYYDEPKYLELAIGDAFKRRSLCVCKAWFWSMEPMMPASFSPEVISVSGIKSNNVPIIPEETSVDYLDISAPCENIYSILKLGWQVPYGIPAYQSTLVQENSLSEAIVAGVISVAWSAHDGYDAKAMKDLIYATATDWGPTGWDGRTGYGMINMGAAVNYGRAKEIKVELKKQLAPLKNLALNPNPATNNVRISLETNSNAFQKASINIFDIGGKLIWKSEVDINGSEGQLNWDTKDMTGRQVASGCYIVSASNDDSKISKKIIIIR